MCEVAGVHVRYPFLDREVVSHSGSIPSALKVRRFKLRYAFKKAFKELLPREIIEKKKHGFGLPISEWLKTDPQLCRFGRNILLDSKTESRGYFKKNFIEKLFKLHAEDKTPYFGAVIWQLLVLELWIRLHVDHESVA
jgi:asparagine synthase (glutamine-hydrolysing)